MSAARPIAAALAVAALAFAAGCGSSSDSTSSSSTSSTTTGSSTVEGQMQAKLDDATQACKDSAGQITNSTVQSAAVAACDQLDSSLSKQIATAAEQSKGDLAKALNDLAAQCRKTAGSLSAGQDVVNSFCDAIAASSSSVSGSG